MFSLGLSWIWWLYWLHVSKKISYQRKTERKRMLLTGCKTFKIKTSIQLDGAAHVFTLHWTTNTVLVRSGRRPGGLKADLSLSHLPPQRVPLCELPYEKKRQTLGQLDRHTTCNLQGHLENRQTDNNRDRLRCCVSDIWDDFEVQMASVLLYFFQIPYQAAPQRTADFSHCLHVNISRCEYIYINHLLPIQYMKNTWVKF